MPLCHMSRHLSLVLATFIFTGLCHACSAPTRSLRVPDSSAAQAPATGDPWQQVCLESSIALPSEVPLWWNEWRLALAANAPDRGHAQLLQAGEQARSTFQALRGPDTSNDGSGANGPALRAWMATWVQSATPLFVVDARGFVLSDAVACPQAHAYASSGDIATAILLLVEARPFLRPGSCAQRCLAALQGE